MTKSIKAKGKKTAAIKGKTKAQLIIGLLCRADGASLAELMKTCAAGLRGEG